MAKLLEYQLQNYPSDEYSGLISFRIPAAPVRVKSGLKIKGGWLRSSGMRSVAGGEEGRFGCVREEGGVCRK